MDVTSITSAAAANSTGTTGAKKNTLTQDDFLKLFTTQLRYQNPLEPLDNFQMATQLAQFNTVDALTKMNETMAQLAANQNSMNNLQIASLIGKKVKAQGNSLAQSVMGTRRWLIRTAEIVAATGCEAHPLPSPDYTCGAGRRFGPATDGSLFEAVSRHNRFRR